MIKIKNDLDTDVKVDIDNGDAIDDIKDEDDNENDAINNDMDTDGNVDVDIDNSDAIDDIKDEDDNQNDAINNDIDTDGNIEVHIDTDNGIANNDEAQSFINKKNVF